MKTKLKTLKKSATLIILFLTLLSFGCKKDKDTAGNPNLLGNWSNVTQTGSVSNRVIYLEFKADGKGREELITITGTQVTEGYNDPFTWSSSGNALQIKFEDAEAETYTFSFNEDETELSIKNEAGDVKVYFKDID